MSPGLLIRMFLAPALAVAQGFVKNPASVANELDVIQALYDVLGQLIASITAFQTPQPTTKIVTKG